MKNKHTLLSSIVALHTVVSGCKRSTESETRGSGGSAAIDTSGSAATGSGETRQQHAAKAATAPVPSGFDLNIALTPQVNDLSFADDTTVRFQGVKSIEEERADFVDLVGHALPVPEKLSDGELWQGTGSWGVEVYRVIEGHRILCRIPNGDDLASVSSCRATFAHGGTLFVPIVVPRESSQVVSLSGVAVSLWRAEEDDPASVEQETFKSKAGLSILRELPQPNGFAVAYQAFNGGIESQGLMYRATMRSQRGGTDLVCRSLASANVDTANKALDICVLLLGG